MALLFPRNHLKRVRGINEWIVVVLFACFYWVSGCISF
jgi:hypothetical protein